MYFLACVNDDGCLPGFLCGTGNCHTSLGLNLNARCCFSKNNCVSPSYYGDDFCQDENNNLECNWDGGDCCGDNLNTQFCSHCDCLNGDVNICTAENPCGLEEGDCDYDNECQPGLTCGTNNCPRYLGLDETIDCCFKPDQCKCLWIQLILNQFYRHL